MKILLHNRLPSMDSHQPIDYQLTWKEDGNATEFRVNGTLIARVLTRKLDHDYFPREVISPLRAGYGLTFAESQMVWLKRRPEGSC